MESDNLNYVEDKELIDVLRQALRSEDSVTRRKAAERLGSLINNGVAELLIVALRDQDLDVREAAAFGLGNLGDKRAVEPLIEILVNTAEPDFIRQVVAEALGKLGDERAIEPLITVLSQTDKVYLPDIDGQTIHTEAARALGKLGEGTLTPLLRLLTDADKQKRFNAATALCYIADPKAFPTLLAALNDEKEEEVQGRVVVALGSTGGNLALPHLVNTLFNSKPVVQQNVMLALGKLGKIEPIIEILTDSNQDPNVRASAAFALGKIGDAQAYQSLLSILKEDNLHLVEQAIKALGKIGDAQILPTLSKLAE